MFYKKVVSEQKAFALLCFEYIEYLQGKYMKGWSLILLLLFLNHECITQRQSPREHFSLILFTNLAFHIMFGRLETLNKC